MQVTVARESAACSVDRPRGGRASGHWTDCLGQAATPRLRAAGHPAAQLHSIADARVVDAIGGVGRPVVVGRHLELVHRAEHRRRVAGAQGDQPSVALRSSGSCASARRALPRASRANARNSGGYSLHPRGSPSPSSSSEVRRADRVEADDARRVDRELRRWRRMYALMPSMNDSSDPGSSSDHAQHRRHVRGQRVREREQRRNARRVVVRAGHHGAGGDVEHRGEVAGPEHRRCAARHANRRRAPQAPPPPVLPRRPTSSAAWCPPARASSETAAAASARSSGWKIRPEWAAS